MAVVFELVANFGDDEQAAAHAANTVPDALRRVAHPIPLHRSLAPAAPFEPFAPGYGWLPH
ncbi:hypothetical protein [Actinophytocola algeriensis]|uniref:Uncharacterized protein n=1 Tax=Actinophytocola algeriensis TaxID=1768010 RepID=A0A7W7VE29_9PSEU|nr:hypothetical protein [Actinophytocola algeriensis]MBB4906826.1 hypothetical protein [Actinophytocola algeriensis]MBE1478307.1 hypothetical protein [Actinophytocola algeriensis]